MILPTVSCIIASLLFSATPGSGLALPATTIPPAVTIRTALTTVTQNQYLGSFSFPANYHFSAVIKPIGVTATQSNVFQAHLNGANRLSLSFNPGSTQLVIAIATTSGTDIIVQAGTLPLNVATTVDVIVRSNSVVLVYYNRILKVIQSSFDPLSGDQSRKFTTSGRFNVFASNTASTAAKAQVSSIVLNRRDAIVSFRSLGLTSADDLGTVVCGFVKTYCSTSTVANCAYVKSLVASIYNYVC